MARTTAGAVRGILGDNYDAESDLAPFIATATALVDRVAACAVLREKTLTAAEKELLERWLAAHFYQQMDQAFSGRNTQGVVSGSFQGQTGMYLEGTKYGQTALSLDYSGCLLAIASGKDRRVAGADWLGKRKSEQVEYDQRD